MDIYTDHRVPFQVGVWARSHRYNVIAVGITKSLKRQDELKDQIKALEAALAEEEKRMNDHIIAAEARIAAGE